MQDKFKNEVKELEFIIKKPTEENRTLLKNQRKI